MKTFGTNTKACLLASAMLLFWGHPARADNAVWLRVRNSTDKDLSSIKIADKYVFGDLKMNQYSEYQEVQNLYPNANAEATSEQARLTVKTANSNPGPLSAGYYTFMLSAHDGSLQIECERDPTLTEVSELRDHPWPETLPVMKNEFEILDGVRKPGIYPLASNRKLSLVDAIKMAGGILDGDMYHTALADQLRVHLMRRVNGQIEDYRLIAWDKHGVLGKDSYFPVLPRDKIIVPVVFY